STRLCAVEIIVYWRVVAQKSFVVLKPGGQCAPRGRLAGHSYAPRNSSPIGSARHNQMPENRSSSARRSRWGTTCARAPYCQALARYLAPPKSMTRRSGRRRHAEDESSHKTLGLGAGRPAPLVKRIMTAERLAFPRSKANKGEPLWQGTGT